MLRAPTFIRVRQLRNHVSFFGTMSSASKHSLLHEYKVQVNQGSLQYDEKQYHVLRYLSRLCDHMGTNYKPSPLPKSQQGASAGVVSRRGSEIKVVHFIGKNRVNHPQPAEQTENITHGEQAEVQASSKAEKRSPTVASRSAESLASARRGTDVGSSVANESAPVRLLKGIYIYGEVGTGKTLLMDRFFHRCNLPKDKKRRVHFHEFLLEIHSRIRDFKQQLIEKHGREVHVNVNVPSERDAIEQVALQVSREAWLLCFDEFQVTDVADALILRRFFDVLWDQGTVLVATSNRPPADLYKNGINRSYFEPFVERLIKQSVVCDINSNIDYRSLVDHSEDCYIVVPERDIQEGKRTTKLWNKFLAIGNDDKHYKMNADSGPADASLVVGDLRPFSSIISIMMGRTMVVDHAFPCLPDSQLHTRNASASDSANPPRLSLHHQHRVIGSWPSEGTLDKKSTSAGDGVTLSESLDKEAIAAPSGAHRGVGWFDFAFLCDQERGASDYQAICREFGTVFLDGVPGLSVLEHDKARRFIVLIDTLYDNHTRFYWSGAAPPADLFRVLTEDEVKGTALEATSTVAAAMASIGDEDSKGSITSEHDASEAPVALHARGEEQLKMSIRLVAKSYLHQQGRDESSRIRPTTDTADSIELMEGELASVQELGFAFRRAASRLTEMAGAEYHAKWAELWRKGGRKL